MVGCMSFDIANNERKVANKQTLPSYNDKMGVDFTAHAYVGAKVKSCFWVGLVFFAESRVCQNR
jgi:hypothetical protein